LIVDREIGDHAGPPRRAFLSLSGLRYRIAVGHSSASHGDVEQG